MYSEKRRQIIKDYLNKNGHASTLELIQATGSSPATIRRDLKEMDAAGLIRRVRGGCKVNAISRENLSNPIADVTPDNNPNLADKDAIARKSATIISPNDIIFVGAGVTCNLLCRYINNRNLTDLTIVTTNITAIQEFKQTPGMTVSLLGGSIHFAKDHIETLDNYNTSSLQKLYFDKIFITVDGADINYGYSIQNPAQLPLYDYLLNNSKESYLLINKSKFNKRAFTHFCSLNTIRNVITNSNANAGYLNYYDHNNINVIIV